MKIHLDEELNICDTCQKSCKRKPKLLRYLKTHNTDKKSTFECDKYEVVFTRGDNLKHQLIPHESTKLPCHKCDKMFRRNFELKQHVCT